ncbi:ribonuclease P protein component [Haploplasma modicum]|uniref:ribonuclease P protein component n=1 Tax=Haploplasma modicum TaxID=2150 RepID=UPI00214B386F|nr:ribonuclease P protein component [Haploplasma modicum]MCR1809301.1 ribonuclease P protein component [Haploplasma modicum]
MKKEYIIKKKSEIDQLFKSKLKSYNKYFMIFLKKSNLNVNFRFAMSIGKKYGNAVERNKIKRQIRSIIRLNQGSIKVDSDFVIVIRPNANILSYQEIESLIIELLLKLKIMETD